MELRRIAYHEAGHAVMAILQRRRLLSVTIEPSSTDIVPGHTQTSKVRVYDSDYKGYRPPSEFRKEICIDLAGPIAEQIGISEKKVGGHCTNDIIKASALSVIMTGGRVERASIAFEEIKEEVEQVLKNNWQAVGSVVSALLDKETLTGHQVRQIVKSHE